MTALSQRTLWTLVALISAMFAFALITVWRTVEYCELDDLEPLTEAAQVEAALQESGSSELFRLTTGIYLQSLSFETANDVPVTGRIWQRTPPASMLRKAPSWVSCSPMQFRHIRAI